MVSVKLIYNVKEKFERSNAFASFTLSPSLSFVAPCILSQRFRYIADSDAYVISRTISRNANLAFLGHAVCGRRRAPRYGNVDALPYQSTDRRATLPRRVRAIEMHPGARFAFCNFRPTSRRIDTTRRRFFLHRLSRLPRTLRFSVLETYTYIRESADLESRSESWIGASPDPVPSCLTVIRH